MERRRFMQVSGLAAAGASGLLARPHRVFGLESPRRLENGQVRLSSNENPLGICEAARAAVVENLEHANRYPGNHTAEVMEALSDWQGVPEASLVLGAGSTEVLQMAVQAMAGPRTPVIIAEPTFEDVPTYTVPFSFELIRVPLGSRLEHDLDRMKAAAGRNRPVVVYFCNPNNPTGTLTPSADIEAWIRDAPETTTFLVDEAYFEYVDDPSYRTAIPLALEMPNVLVVRTFSKIFGMAGLRLGYGVGHPDTVGRLREFILKNNSNVLACAAAVASMQDPDMVAESRRVNTEARSILESCLNELEIDFFPSHTNFMMHRVPNLSEYRARMADAGFLVGRDFPPMLDFNRVSFGLPEDMERFAETLRSFRAKGWV